MFQFPGHSYCENMLCFLFDLLLNLHSTVTGEIDIHQHKIKILLF